MHSVDKEESTYLTYRGTSHVPLIFGIPLMIVLVCTGIFAAILFVAILFLHSLILAFVLGSLNLAFLVWVKIECEIDSRAMQIRRLELVNRVKRTGKKELIITSQKPGKNQEHNSVQRYFKRLNRFL